MPVTRETDALAAAARRHLRRRTVRFAGLIGVGVMIAAVIGTLSMQAGRWQSGLLATGSQVEGTVISALLVGSQRRSNESHVTVQYFTPDGRDHSFSFPAVNTSRYRPGERVTVYDDPARRGHHRTRWDAPRTATQNSSAAILLLSAVIALVGLLGLPRAVIGMRLGRGAWHVAEARVSTIYAWPQPALLLVELGADGDMFAAPRTGRAHLRTGTYLVRTVNRGPWCVVTTKAGTAVVRRARSRHATDSWRTQIARHA